MGPLEVWCDGKKQATIPEGQTGKHPLRGGVLVRVDAHEPNGPAEGVLEHYRAATLGFTLPTGESYLYQGFVIKHRE